MRNIIPLQTPNQGFSGCYSGYYSGMPIERGKIALPRPGSIPIHFANSGMNLPMPAPPMGDMNIKIKKFISDKEKYIKDA